MLQRASQHQRLYPGRGVGQIRPHNHPPAALGIDLGGTKIAGQIFDTSWGLCASTHIDTPTDYADLVRALAKVADWATDTAGGPLAIGIGTAGLINPADGTALAANLPISGHRFGADIAQAIGQPVTVLNDSRAFALSEASLGVGQGYRTVLGLIIGTGVGGGIAIDGQLIPGAGALGGEFGHTSASAPLVLEHGLPLVRCGCGRIGCIETLVSGAGLARIGTMTMNETLGPRTLVTQRSIDPRAQAAWDIWCKLAADLIRDLILTVDPDCIVLGGGLSRIPDITTDLTTATAAAHLPGFPVPPIILAEGGATSGARGAAYAAFTAQK